MTNELHVEISLDNWFFEKARAMTSAAFNNLLIFFF